MSQITSTESNIRLDSFLVKNAEFISRSSASKACKDGLVLVNSKPRLKSYKVQIGDVVEYSFISPSAPGKDFHIDLDIKYEDDDIIVLSKPAGLICHSAPGNNSNTLVDALVKHCGKDNLYRGDCDNRLGIVHRLDKNTSGLMIIAKSQKAGEKLTEDMKNHSTSRHYKALVHGIVEPNTAKIDAPLLRIVKTRPKMMVRDDFRAKDAITTFKVIKRFSDYTLLDCKIHTGRTHQIRAHMEFINHPVVGDELYGGSTNLINRQFLHSFKIGFNHPVSGELMNFEDDLAKDLSKVLESLK